MSEAVRAVALAEANKHHQGGDADAAAVVATATKFLNFLSADAAPGKHSAAGAEPGKQSTGKTTPAADPKKAAKEAVKKAAEEKAAKEALAKANAEEGGGEDEYVFPTEPLEPNEESVGAIVQAFIKSDRRQEAIDLLGKYKAKGVSKLIEKGDATIAKFVNDGNVLLGLAEASDDLS